MPKQSGMRTKILTEINQQKSEILKKITDWLDTVELGENEELTCHADENQACIKVWNNKEWECRTDARTKAERDRIHRLIIERRTGKKI